MTSRVRASMLVIGDEILDGHTRDTNSGWLAGRLSELGVPLERIVTVPDDVDAIGEALHTELGRRRPRLVLSSGGIGSTPDDLTIEAVAAYLDVEVKAHPELDAHVSDWAEQARAEGAEIEDAQERALRKMALVPDGSYLLEGSSGVLPGVAIDVAGGISAGGATVVVLPGVPALFRSIVDTSVRELLSGLGRPDHVAEIRHPYPESALSPALDELVAAFPDVRVGSYPGRECLVRLKGPRDAVERAAAVVRARVEALGRSKGAQRLSERWQARWE